MKMKPCVAIAALLAGACSTNDPPAAGPAPLEASPRTSMDLMQSTGSMLMECRIKLRDENCKQYGRESYACEVTRDLDRDGIFSKIRDKTVNEFDVLVEADAALKSCRGIWE